ncbi:Glycosyltransferase involved in cell wall bisynthesis [Tenacibaculum sp. MAR_2010_89]|uniref:glycosyltransferase family 2 protein n=1 Tax=Tenacibaculum sp. MAR_2010_89 TaxID=1250198 RepID=UPI00089D52E2|nr:glycosyltransferase family 2 protein [Tenacibaculum sp. MAR_2010_89]SEE50535.1 Glycosyltransferase involved in cell wall bisynthesis [Tenacibaculum sp. MAR_2010_89]
MIDQKNNIELSIVIPCLDEAETIEICIKKAKKFLLTNNISGEIVVGDNGSKDGSIELIKKNGARLVHINKKGYGAALMGAIEAARGKFIIMGDADDSYDFSNLMPYILKLREGYDLVMGNRFKGGIKKGAMPFLHKYLGNPVLSFIGRLFFKIKIRDFHCGLRGFRKDSIKKLELRTTGMEFASEMVVKSSIFKLKITEVPTILSKDGRSRPPHLRTWRDGWRHLKFLLMYSPKWLFFYPGMFFFLLSTLFFIIISINPIHAKELTFDLHTLTYCGAGIILSYQILSFSFLSRIYAINQGLIPVEKKFLNIFNFFNLEKGLLAGIFIFILGFLSSLNLFMDWRQEGYGNINDLNVSFRVLIPSVVMIIVGIQTIFLSFLSSIIGTIQNIKFLDE